MPQRREGDLGVKSADSVSSEEGRALPCLTGPQGTGKVGMVVRVWVKTGASSRVPTGARPGPEASARCLVSGLTWYPPLCYVYIR